MRQARSAKAATSATPASTGSRRAKRHRAVRGDLAEAEDHERDARGEQQQARASPAARAAASRPSARAGGQQPRREHEPDDADRQVDEEDPAPRQVGDEQRRRGPARAPGPSSIGTPTTLITRPMRCGPAAWARVIIPIGMIIPPARPCRTRKAMSDSALHASAAQRARGHEGGDHRHPHAPRAEALGRPAGERDHGGQREQVAAGHPLDRRQRRVEVASTATRARR